MNCWHLGRVAAALKAGGVVLHATEGVWGLACDPFNLTAVLNILALKQREVGKGLIVVGADAEDFAPELASLGEAERARVEASWPGAATWILPSRRFPVWVTGGSESVAVRVAGHVQVRALSARFGAPIVSTSANPGGRAPAKNRFKAQAYFHGSVDYVLPGEVLDQHGPSCIRTTDGKILRGRR